MSEVIRSLSFIDLSTIVMCNTSNFKDFWSLLKTNPRLCKGEFYEGLLKLKLWMVVHPWFNPLDLHSPDKFGKTPLHKAVWDYGDDAIDISIWLLNAGVECNSQDQDGWTPLMKAAFKKNFELVKLLLEFGAKDSLNLQNSCGWTALMWAAFWDYPDIVRILLQYGADKDLKSGLGYDAISVAKSDDVIDLLNDIDIESISIELSMI
tara:strand:+ start:2117 stop:2737 length:621 start_codon:yes stop_codon:yes gene_type:complete